MHEKLNPTLVSFDFCKALSYLKDGLRVIDIKWEIGHWLFIKNGDIILEYIDEETVEWKADSYAILIAQYSIVK